MPVAAQTRLYHPALAGTPPEEGNWNHLGGLFPTPQPKTGRNKGRGGLPWARFGL